MIPEMAVVPSGGYRFVQRLPSGAMQLFAGSSHDDLIQQVQTFRLNNNIDLGPDLEAEVKQGISAQSHKYPGEQRSLRERVTGWVANRMYTKPEFVEPEEADRRAKICVDCKLNNVKYADSCLECHSHTEHDAFALRAGKSSSQDHWLGACEHYGHHNPTAIWLSGSSLLHRRQKEPPDCPCWLKELDKETSSEVQS